MTKLSVNINKIATLRNARGENVPDVVAVARRCEDFGADGITVHPRPDQRHIRHSDVRDLRTALRSEFNIEGYPSPEFISLVLEARPTQVTLVPDAPDAITSSAGWDVEKHASFLTQAVAQFRKAGIRTSIFVNPDEDTVRAAAKAGADRVELYTKPYADGYDTDRHAAIAPYIRASQVAHSFGLGVNAGHDLSLHNLQFMHRQLPHLDEVSIGHALICDALFLGLQQTIKQYLACLGR